MNRVHKVIWSNARGAFVAASELGKARGKGSAGGAATICDDRCAQPSVAAA
ncbi:ESPR domain-containing protein, partial [Bacillus sp. SIMBA_031]